MEDAKAAVLFGEAGSFGGEATIEALARGAWRHKPAASIRGSGYGVESLEAALWCFARKESYEETVLLAANLGDDADTTAAVTGQIAGAFCGMSWIPAERANDRQLSDHPGVVVTVDARGASPQFRTGVDGSTMRGSGRVSGLCSRAPEPVGIVDCSAMWGVQEMGQLPQCGHRTRRPSSSGTRIQPLAGCSDTGSDPTPREPPVRAGCGVNHLAAAAP